MNKTIVVIFITIGILAFIFYRYSHQVFRGTFDKKYTREELEKNFVQHEGDFEDLVKYFKSNVSERNEEAITFGSSNFNKVSLLVHPYVITTTTKPVGGNDLELDSPQLDSALIHLGWSKEIVKNLEEKLVKTNCNWIRTTEIYGGNPIEIYPNQKGWSSYAYHIFNKPLSDSLIQIHGKPIGNSEFGKAVALDHSSAL